ncbi:MAG: hypothetical protein ACTSQO_13435 [Candidatus Helarchaeota archaeon]
MNIEVLNEANLIFQFNYVSENPVSINKSFYIKFYLNNTGNLTAIDIYFTIYKKFGNSTDFNIIQKLNYSGSIAPNSLSSPQYCYLKENKIGTYYYKVEVQYNYTWNSTTYMKFENSSNFCVSVVMYQPSVYFYIISRNGLTLIQIKFNNFNNYINLRYKLLIQISGSKLETYNFNISYSSAKTFIYNISLSPAQLNWWDKLIYYSNWKIEKRITLFYRILVNDSEGNNYNASVQFNNYGNGQTILIDAEHFNTLISLEFSLSFTEMCIFFIILICIIIGSSFLINYFRKSKTEDKLLPLFRKIQSYEKRKVIVVQFNQIELIKYRTRMINWIVSRTNSHFLYIKLKYIYPIITTVFIINSLVSFIFLIINTVLINLIFVYWSIVSLILSVILSLIFTIKNRHFFKQIFPQFCEENPDIELISKDTWLYTKKYRSLFDFLMGFGLYGIEISTIIFISLIFVAQYIIIDLFTLLMISLIGGLIFGLIIGLIYYYKFNYYINPIFFLGVISFTFGYIFTYSFNLNQIPFFIPLGIFLLLSLLIGYLINKFINKLIDKKYIRKIANDLKSFFEKNEKLYLPNLTWIKTLKNLKLLIKSLSFTDLDLIIKNEYLVKNF